MLCGGLHVDVLPRGDVVGGHEVVGEGVGPALSGRRPRVHELAVGEQLEGVHVDLLLRLAAFADDVPGVVVREARLDAVARVVREGEGDRPRRCDGGVVGEARAFLGQRFDQLGFDPGQPLHVAAVPRVQHLALDPVSRPDAVARHLRAPREHLPGHHEGLLHDRRRPLLPAQGERGLPAGDRHLPRHALGERGRCVRAVLQAQHRQGRAEAEVTHPVAPLAQDLLALRSERKSVDLHDVVEHAGEDGDGLAERLPVEARAVGERVEHEPGEVDRAEEAGAVGGEGLLAAGVGRADVLAEPVVVHVVDLVDQDEPRFGEVVRRRHDDVPDPPGPQGAVHPARDLSEAVGDVAVVHRPAPPHHRLRVVEIDAAVLDLVRREGERELPLGVGADRLHEFAGDEQREVELAQAAVLALGADEVEDVGMADVEGGHLRAAAPARGRHREAHPVVDVHERQRPRRIRPGAGDVRAPGAQGGELVPDAAAGLEGEAGLVDLLQDAVHRVVDGAGHRAVDRRRGRLVLQCPRVRDDAPGRDRALAQRPQEAFVPARAKLAGGLGGGDRPRDPLPGLVDLAVDDRAVALLQAVLPVPDVVRGRLQRDRGHVGSVHAGMASSGQNRRHRFRSSRISARRGRLRRLGGGFPVEWRRKPWRRRSSRRARGPRPCPPTPARRLFRQAPPTCPGPS